MTHHALPLQALPFGINATIVLAAGVAIALRERFSRLGWLHLGLSCSIGAWQLSTLMAVLAQTQAEGAQWMKLATYGALLMVGLVFHFAATVSGNLRAKLWQVTAVWAAVGVLGALLWSPLFHTNTVHYRWGWFSTYGPAGWAFIGLTAIVVNAAIGMYFTLYRTSRPGSLAHRRAGLLMGALVIGAIGSVDFLPPLGFDFYPIGGFPIMIANLINVYTTWRYRLIEITPAYAADQLMDAMSDGVLIIDRDGMVRLVNPAACEILGMQRARLVNRLPPEALASEVLGWQHVPFFPSADTSLGERDYHMPDGTRRVLDVSVSLMNERGLEPDAASITLRDVTAAVQAQEQIHRLAYYDSLTHLPNRLLLRERFDEAMARARRAHSMMAVLFMDLDRFKHVNDSLGHDAGDMLLKGVAERITACVRETDSVVRHADGASGPTLARLGGDEFVLLLAPIERPEDAAKVAIRILEALARPFSLKRGAEVGTGASIGISVYPHDGEEPETLMKKADLAMYQAKENGRNAFRYHDDDMNASVLARTDLESRLRRGVAHKEFVLHYQPQLAPHSGEIAGVDATVYWRHPERGLVLASDYLAGSEEPGVIVPLTEWMVRTACMQLRVWQEQGLAPMYMTLSLPPGIAERADLTRLIHEALTHARIDPTLLMLNLRPAASRDTGRTPGAMHALQAMGVRLVFDDLGLGTASLAHVAQYPLSMVRLPATLLRGLAREGELVTVARSLIGLLHDLDLGTLTTGVESPAVLSILREANCDLAQGGAIGAAMPPEEIPALLAGSRQRAAAI
jgi:diguanylate cyclase (GGDEF)-like protein/PAS domain S-box-containing protein